jgi:hypothetical protein
MIPVLDVVKNYVWGLPGQVERLYDVYSEIQIPYVATGLLEVAGGIAVMADQSSGFLQALAGGLVFFDGSLRFADKNFSGIDFDRFGGYAGMIGRARQAVHDFRIKKLRE